VRRRREEEMAERGGAREHREAVRGEGGEASLRVARGGVYSGKEWGEEAGGRETRGWRRAAEPYRFRFRFRLLGVYIRFSSCLGFWAAAFRISNFQMMHDEARANFG
jgi:hypothetical protein